MPAQDLAKSFCDGVLDKVDTVVVGKREQTKMLVAALAAGGHVLVEDVPGVGKTLLARTFAAVVDLSFKRIQFTPDLLPSDVTGTHVFSQKDGEFHWRPGPIFANVVLADELNRATPRTQSSLLEAMEERQVTCEGVTLPLPSPFMVIATQNPIEMEGTFPLPEAQIDRFLLKIEMGYPTLEEESLVLERFADNMGAAHTDTPSWNNADRQAADRAVGPEVSQTAGLATGPEVGQAADPAVGPNADTAHGFALLVKAAEDAYLSPEVTRYILDLARRTREHSGVSLGVSPRGALYLARVSKVWAALDGRDYVLPDDVKKMAIPCLAHRLIPRTQASLRGQTGKDIIAEVLEETPVPVNNEAPHPHGPDV